MFFSFCRTYINDLWLTIYLAVILPKELEATESLLVPVKVALTGISAPFKTRLKLGRLGAFT